MLRRVAVVCALVAVTVVAVSSSRSDSEPSTIDSPMPTEEPITGTPVMPAPGSETPAKDPFTPYDPGPPEAIWRYEDLTAAEKAVVDAGRSASHANVHAGYDAAVREQATAARAQGAATLLGVEDLGSIGVIP